MSVTKFKDMSKKKKVIVILVVIVIIASNFIPLNKIIVMVERDADYFSYSLKDDTTSFGFEHGLGPKRFVYFLQREVDIKNGIPRNDTLYRNFKINPLRFWHWKDYFIDERYTLPYISVEEVYANAIKKSKR